MERSQNYLNGVRHLKSLYGDHLPTLKELNYSWGWSFPQGKLMNHQKIGVIGENNYTTLSGETFPLTLVVSELGPIQLFYDQGDGQFHLIETLAAHEVFITLRHPKTDVSRRVMVDLQNRIERIEELMSTGSRDSVRRAQALSELFHMMYGFYNVVPFWRGSASIGNILFDVIYRHYFGRSENDYLPISPYGLDVEAMVMSQQDFVETMLQRMAEARR